jgi:hypothetical protein
MSPVVAQGGHARRADQRPLMGVIRDRKLLFSVDGQFHYWRILSPHMANEAPE